MALTASSLIFPIGSFAGEAGSLCHPIGQFYGGQSKFVRIPGAEATLVATEDMSIKLHEIGMAGITTPEC